MPCRGAAHPRRRCKSAVCAGIPALTLPSAGRADRAAAAVAGGAAASCDDIGCPGRPWHPGQLRGHVQRTARAWSLDGQPLLGISVFAVLGEPLDDLLRRRFATFRTIYLPTAGMLAEHGFELLPTAQRPHFTLRLRRADDQELVRLLEALGAPQPNPAYPGNMA